MAVEEVKVPDMGGTKGADVIELCVQVGSVVSKEDPLIVLESDKATFEVPSPLAGQIKELRVAVGQTVSEGVVIALVETGATAPAPQLDVKKELAAAPAPVASAAAPVAASVTEQIIAATSLDIIRVPDIGGAHDVDVIEILVKAGDSVQKEQPIIVLESDKATMEIPSPKAGVVKEIMLHLNDKVSQGSAILQILSSDGPAVPAKPSSPGMPFVPPPPEPPAPAPIATPKPVEAAPVIAGAKVHAGPAVRRLASELGVDLSKVVGTGPKGRILKDDVHAWVKLQLTQPAVRNAPVSMGAIELPEIDFSRFGEIETVELTKIQRSSAANLHRAWTVIPHVTQFDQADITDLEAFRKQIGSENSKVKYTMLAFLVAACAKALRDFPKFNSSLDKSGEKLIMKKYVHIGIAVDTPNGLVVPVVKNADKLSISEIAETLTQLSVKARDKKLTPGDMQGACFSISSLGGIGGTAFTPIVNWPEVAILGVSRSSMQPVYQNGQFVPRLMLPLSLSYDHRVIDGADAARFTTHLAKLLADLKRLLI
ncbi:MAG TPA: dihydrolipoyllysine-residue acetyltransferase [Pseudomonadales bacterium]|nr:dihydrolipoyllysine-residue acetyltransferase [Pseudomonadales bacterium]